jgi:hypothetical protein
MSRALLNASGRFREFFWMGTIHNLIRQKWINRIDCRRIGTLIQQNKGSAAKAIAPRGESDNNIFLADDGSIQSAIHSVDATTRLELS